MRSCHSSLKIMLNSPLAGDIDKPVDFTTCADVIAEEGALAKDEVLHVRGRRKAGMVCIAINFDHAHVVWWEHWYW